MKIRRQINIGTCCEDERFIWITEEVTPRYLRTLINRGETIRLIQTND